jgi:putative PIN family toxin of toxin-antitoxin system
MDEFIDVALRPKITKYVTSQDIVDTIVLMKSYCIIQTILVNAVSPVRDKNDLYLLSLADTILANYLITGDKDLLILQHHNQTEIVTYTEFMTLLGA